MSQFANIEAERARLGLTKTMLAAEMEISLNTYNKYIAGTVPIPSDKIIYLHKRFGVSTDYLLGVAVPEYRINH